MISGESFAFLHMREIEALACAGFTSFAWAASGTVIPPATDKRIFAFFASVIIKAPLFTSNYWSAAIQVLARRLGGLYLPLLRIHNAVSSKK
ncbi:hypothetical protein D9M68_846710 [compost metagenome]